MKPYLKRAIKDLDSIFSSALDLIERLGPMDREGVKWEINLRTRKAELKRKLEIIYMNL